MPKTESLKGSVSNDRAKARLLDEDEVETLEAEAAAETTDDHRHRPAKKKGATP